MKDIDLKKILEIRKKIKAKMLADRKREHGDTSWRGAGLKCKTKDNKNEENKVRTNKC